MGQSVRIPITNIFMDGDYTGQIFVGAANKQLNVILDTGSSALALDAKKYEPSHGDTTTKLAQEDSYGDGSGWTGAVIQTTVTVGSGAAPLALPQANVALAYQATANMFRGADGILGLAYAALDDAYEMPADTWATKYPATQVQTGRKTTIAPYLTELASANVTSDIVSFYTKRSQIHLGGDPNDPLNQGVMIIGGGQDAKDLYTGGFQTAKVLADAWYCTNLKAILVGASTINVPARGAKGMPSNSIVDSGTNSLNLPRTLLNAIAAKLPEPGQKTLFLAALKNEPVSVSKLDLASWPTISFVLQGDTGDVTLNVTPDNYWQVDAGRVGEALLGFTPGQSGLSILGLPLMNGYFTIFDGEADGGVGSILFATRA